MQSSDVELSGPYNGVYWHQIYNSSLGFTNVPNKMNDAMKDSYDIGENPYVSLNITEYDAPDRHIASNPQQEIIMTCGEGKINIL